MGFVIATAYCVLLCIAVLIFDVVAIVIKCIHKPVEMSVAHAVLFLRGLGPFLLWFRLTLGGIVAELIYVINVQNAFGFYPYAMMSILSTLFLPFTWSSSFIFLVFWTHLLES